MMSSFLFISHIFLGEIFLRAILAFRAIFLLPDKQSHWTKPGSYIQQTKANFPSSKIMTENLKLKQPDGIQASVTPRLSDSSQYETWKVILPSEKDKSVWKCIVAAPQCVLQPVSSLNEHSKHFTVEATKILTALYSIHYVIYPPFIRTYVMLSSFGKALVVLWSLLYLLVLLHFLVLPAFVFSCLCHHVSR